jgi:hypothetical protein
MHFMIYFAQCKRLAWQVAFSMEQTMNRLQYWLWRIKVAFLLRGMTPEQRAEATLRMTLALMRKYSPVLMTGETQRRNIPYPFHKED